MNTEFEWDTEKAKLNLLKHGVAFAEAATVFLTHCQSQCLTRCIPATKIVSS
jgi:uncharacterized DUF497 family protein